MRTARDTGLLFSRYLTQLLRNPVWLVVGFSTPILYLALFAPLLKNLPGVQAVPGGNVLDPDHGRSGGPAHHLATTIMAGRTGRAGYFFGR